MSVVISREQEHRLFDVNTEGKVCSRRRGSLRCLGMQQKENERVSGDGHIAGDATFHYS